MYIYTIDTNTYKFICEHTSLRHDNMANRAPRWCLGVSRGGGRYGVFVKVIAEVFDEKCSYDVQGGFDPAGAAPFYPNKRVYDPLRVTPKQWKL